MIYLSLSLLVFFSPACFKLLIWFFILELQPRDAEAERRCFGLWVYEKDGAFCLLFSSIWHFICLVQFRGVEAVMA